MTLVAAAVLLLTVLAGCWRVWRGPTIADRLLALQIFGTTGIAVLMLLAHRFGRPDLLEAALILALLAAVLPVALAQLARDGEGWDD